MAAHSTLGASGAHRWMKCPGSVRMADQGDTEPRSSQFAALGTVAHTLLENQIINLDSAQSHLGETIEQDGFQIEVDDDLVSAVETAADALVELLGQYPEAELYSEMRVSLKGLKPAEVAETMFGTADLILWDGETLVIADYKHGAGVPVEAVGNPQLRYYALGACMTLNVKPKHIRAVVIQPRAPHADGPIREDAFGMSDLRDFATELMAAAQATQKPDAPLVAGEHCRFCPALARCPEKHNESMGKAQLVFKQGRIEPPAAPEELTPEQRQAVLDSADDVIAWLKAVKEDAHRRLERGESLPGWKLVAKRATRTWTKDADDVADELCERFGLGDEDMFDRKLRSPAQIEKLVSKEEKAQLKDLIQSVVPEGSTLARESDKRKALDPNTQAAAKFGPQQ
jgi:hypothetical protein